MPERSAVTGDVPAGTEPPRVTATAASFATAKADVAVCFAFESHKIPSIPGMPATSALLKALAAVMRADSFKGKRKEIVVWQSAGRFAADRYIVVGLGRATDLTAAAIRDACGLAARRAIAVKAKRMVVALPPEAAADPIERMAEAVTEGIALGAYRMAKYLTGDNARPDNIKSADLLVSRDLVKSAQPGVARGSILAEATNLVRDLVNEPAMVVTPQKMAEVARRIAKESNLEIRVHEKKDLERLGMGAILGVSAGSAQPPCVIHLIYRPGGSRAAVTAGKRDGRKTRRVALVGKGLTFDSGGLSLKTASGMETMKLDKAGATVVLGVMKALPRLELPLEVHGILGMTENMPSGSALKPGDVLRTMSGKTIEVLNTDAEGRLVLADALEYAQQLEPERIIDLATLTGACMVALGPIASGLFSTDEKMVQDLLAAAERAGERMWQLPLYDEYREMIRSDIADVKNAPSSRYGGAITAALFLKNFVDKSVPWAHLDIAGPAFLESEQGYMRKGATGAPVRSLINYLEAIAASPS